MAVIFQVSQDPELLHRAAQLRYEVYVTEQGWLDPNPEKIDVDVWDDVSDHIIATGTDGAPLGVMRVIPHSSLGFPFETSHSHTIDNPDIWCEISRLAVTPKARGRCQSLILLAMGRYVWRIAQQRGLHYWCALMDCEVVTLFAKLGFQFLFTGKPVFHVGSDCQFVVCTMEETHRMLFSDQMNARVSQHTELEMEVLSGR